MQIEHNGRTQSATAWARELGIDYMTLRWRLEHWPKERALTMQGKVMHAPLTFQGRMQSATAWARELGITYQVLRWRLQHWSKERALTAPKQSNAKQLTFNGRTQSVTEWARELGIAPRTLRDRLLRGEPPELALTYGWREKREAMERLEAFHADQR
jgi:hypothetical protein